MQSSIVSRLDELAAWRADMDRSATSLSRFLLDHELVDEPQTAALATLRERLSTDRLVLAFVAEFSRGKSELINAIFFAEAGRRVLPATPGRTTMCPVELYHDAKAPARLSLLPIETRLRGLSLAELRKREEVWHHVPLDIDSPDGLVKALTAVTRTQHVSVEVARGLGFWNDGQPEDNPALQPDGQVEVPAWRHALINYPHPLLRRGLVVVDTPGLNAIGAEPELTLGLLPSAHATVFVLAADTGVTKSDLAIWREHLSSGLIERYVVLNKIDSLYDPLLTPAEVESQIQSQCRSVAQTLEVPGERVFPLSARDALAARVAGNDEALARSRLGQLEQALSAGLLPRQRDLIEQSVLGVVERLRSLATHRLDDRRRHLTEQALELRGLRGKSGSKVRLMLQRIDAERAEFERCTSRLQAVRVVQQRMLRSALQHLSGQTLRTEVTTMQQALAGRPFAFGGKQAFATLCDRLRKSLDKAQAEAEEIRQMLDGSFIQLNAEYGFSFSLQSHAELERFGRELDLIDHNYSQYLGLLQSWRMASTSFVEQFRRMLLSKLRVVFEGAASELELWSRAASNQVDLQLAERRRAFKHRREALERIQSAAGELEQRIAEVEAQLARLDEQGRQLDRQVQQLLRLARGEQTQPGGADAGGSAAAAALPAAAAAIAAATTPAAPTAA